MNTIYFATGNKQKIKRLATLFQLMNTDIKIESIPELIDVEESGKTPSENAEQKITVYQGKGYKYPIIAGDTALYFDGIDFDPTHVKRQAIKDAGKQAEQLSQEDIYEILLEYYKKRAQEVGGELEFYYLDGWAVLFPNDEIKTTEYKRENILTDQFHGEKQLYFPMSNLYKSKKTNKPYTSRNDQDYLIEFAPQIDAMKKLFDL